MSDVRRQLEEIRSESYRLVNTVELLRQAHSHGLPGSVQDAMRLAATNYEIAASLMRRAIVELTERARVIERTRDSNIITLEDLGRAMQQDATAFPVCVRCGLEAYECACDAPEAA